MAMQSSIEIAKFLSLWDYGIFFGVLILTLLVVLLTYNRQRTSSLVQYMLIGRRLTLPLFVATLVSTWYGGIFGVTQIAFESGIYNFLIQGLFWYLAYFLFAWLIVNRISHREAMTLPELVRQKIGPKAGTLASFFNITNVLPVTYVISMGLLVNILFGVPFVPAMILGTAFVLLYSSVSGYWADVASDVVQFFVMVSAVILVLVFSVFTYGGWSFLTSHLPTSHFNLWGSVPLATTLVWGFIALSTLVDPNFYQVCFAAESTQTAKKGIYISIGIWFVFDICTTGGALYAKALIPEANSSQAYLLYALQLLPEGLKGFFLAGVLATILSTIDTYLFIASNTVCYDLFPNVLKNKITWHRVSILFVGAAAIALGSAFDGNIKSVWKTLGSYSAACMLFPVLITYFFPGRISDWQFVLSASLGALGITWHRLIHPLWEIDEFYVGLLFTGTTLLMFEMFKPVFYDKRLAKAASKVEYSNSNPDSVR
jgi:SSS family solute:Na+ symporter